MRGVGGLTKCTRPVIEPDFAGTIAAVVGGGMGVGIVVGSLGELPHPANSPRMNVKPMICRNDFLVLIIVIFLFLVEVNLVINGLNVTQPPIY
jgi:hypothetical protein